MGSMVKYLGINDHDVLDLLQITEKAVGSWVHKSITISDYFCVHSKFSFKKVLQEYVRWLPYAWVIRKWFYLDTRLCVILYRSEHETHITL